MASTSRVTGSEPVIACIYEVFGRRDVPFIRHCWLLGRTGTRAGKIPAEERRRRRG